MLRGRDRVKWGGEGRKIAKRKNDEGVAKTKMTVILRTSNGDEGGVAKYVDGRKWFDDKVWYVKTK